jgi:hypothetical protein
MATNLIHMIRDLASSVSSRWSTGSPIHRTPVPHGPSPAELGPQVTASPFSRWVDELDDEVSAYISRHELAQLLMLSERRSAAVKARQTARRQREVLPSRWHAHP